MSVSDSILKQTKPEKDTNQQQQANYRFAVVGFRTSHLFWLKYGQTSHRSNNSL